MVILVDDLILKVPLLGLNLMAEIRTTQWNYQYVYILDNKTMNSSQEKRNWDYKGLLQSCR